MIAIAPTVVAPTVGTLAIVPTDNDAESLFLKGTKHSISDYKVFKEAKHWNTWGQHLLATAAAHGISDVLSLHMNILLLLKKRSSNMHRPLHSVF